jgi:hypothetical protein
VGTPSPAMLQALLHPGSRACRTELPLFPTLFVTNGRYDQIITQKRKKGGSLTYTSRASPQETQNVSLTLSRDLLRMTYNKLTA